VITSLVMTSATVNIWSLSQAWRCAGRPWPGAAGSQD
jgi:hypothetical protein